MRGAVGRNVDLVAKVLRVFRKITRTRKRPRITLRLKRKGKASEWRIWPYPFIPPDTRARVAYPGTAHPGGRGTMIVQTRPALRVYYWNHRNTLKESL